MAHKTAKTEQSHIAFAELCDSFPEMFGLVPVDRFCVFSWSPAYGHFTAFIKTQYCGDTNSHYDKDSAAYSGNRYKQAEQHCNEFCRNLPDLIDRAYQFHSVNLVHDHDHAHIYMCVTSLASH